MAGEAARHADLLEELKSRIHAAQVRAPVAVNRELVLLCWQIGRDILARQREAGWGAKVVERLVADLRREFPEMTGLSPRNLKCMRAFAEAYSEEPCLQRTVAQVPWGQNVVLLDKVEVALEA